MLLSYWRAYAAAKLGNEDMYRMFLTNIESSINYLFGNEFYEGSLQRNIHKFTLERFENQKLINLLGSDKVLQVILLMQQQFNKIPKEIYQIVILNKALSAIDEGIIQALPN